MYTLRLQSFRKGEVIFTEGSRGADAYVIHEGEVEILKSGPQRQPVSLRVMTAGEMFGEMGLVTSNPRAATAVARTDVSLEVIDQEAFWIKMKADSAFAVETVRRLAGMIPEAQSKLLSQMHQVVEASRTQAARGRFGLGRGRVEDVHAFAPDFVRIKQEPVPWLLKYAGAVILGLMASVVAWATVATTETVVTGTGRVITSVPHVAVQPMDSGVVREVAVREGEVVTRGQRLATLDPTVAEADLLSLRVQLRNAGAQVARLRAELTGTVPPRFSDDPAVQAVQAQLFASRSAQRTSTLGADDEEIRSLGTQIEAREREQRDLEAQLHALREIAAVREAFYTKEREAFLRDGQYRLQYLESQRALAASERDRTQLAATVATLKAQVRAKRSQRDAWIGEWRARANQELVAALEQHAQLAEQVKKAERARALIEITAPTDAVVLSVKTRTPGTIVRPGDAMFDLVPTAVSLEAEVDVGPGDIARIRTGDAVTVKLDSLPFTRHGTIDGRLRLISEDAFERTMQGQPGATFRVRVELGQSHLAQIPADFRLLPGMTLSADIKTGTRSLVTYVTYPVSRALSTSFREP